MKTTTHPVHRFAAILASAAMMLYAVGHAAAQTDTTAPAAPTGLAVTAYAQTSVAFAWLPSTDDTGVAGYRVYEKHNYGWHNQSVQWLLRQDNLSVTDALVDALVVGSSHTYVVRAFDAAGNESVNSVQLPIRTYQPPNVGLPATASANATNAFSYKIGSGGNPAPVLTLLSGPEGLTMDGTGQVQWTPTIAQVGAFTASVHCENSEGAVEGVLTINVSGVTDIAPPSWVSDVAFTNIVSNGADISWTAATDNVAVTSYKVNVFCQLAYRKQLNMTLDTGGPVTSFHLSSDRIVPSKQYKVKIYGVDAAGNEGWSQDYYFTTPAGPVVTPADPIEVGDFDSSGCTDTADFLYVLDYWDTVAPIGDPAIGINDFLTVLDNWMIGTGCK